MVEMLQEMQEEKNHAIFGSDLQTKHLAEKWKVWCGMRYILIHQSFSMALTVFKSVKHLPIDRYTFFINYTLILRLYELVYPVQVLRLDKRIYVVFLPHFLHTRPSTGQEVWVNEDVWAWCKWCSCWGSESCESCSLTNRMTQTLSWCLALSWLPTALWFERICARFIPHLWWEIRDVSEEDDFLSTVATFYIYQSCELWQIHAPLHLSLTSLNALYCLWITALDTEVKGQEGSWMTRFYAKSTMSSLSCGKRIAVGCHL